MAWVLQMATSDNTVAKTTEVVFTGAWPAVPVTAVVRDGVAWVLQMATSDNTALVFLPRFKLAGAIVGAKLVTFTGLVVNVAALYPVFLLSSNTSHDTLSPAPSLFSPCILVPGVTELVMLVKIDPSHFSPCILVPGVTAPVTLVKIDPSLFSPCILVPGVTALVMLVKIDPSHFSPCTPVPDVTTPAMLLNTVTSTAVASISNGKSDITLGRWRKVFGDNTSKRALGVSIWNVTSLSLEALDNHGDRGGVEEHRLTRRLRLR